MPDWEESRELSFNDFTGTTRSGLAELRHEETTDCASNFRIVLTKPLEPH